MPLATDHTLRVLPQETAWWLPVMDHCSKKSCCSAADLPSCPACHATGCCWIRKLVADGSCIYCCLHSCGCSPAVPVGFPPRPAVEHCHSSTSFSALVAICRLQQGTRLPASAERIPHHLHHIRLHRALPRQQRWRNTKTGITTPLTTWLAWCFIIIVIFIIFIIFVVVITKHAHALVLESLASEPAQHTQQSVTACIRHSQASMCVKNPIAPCHYRLVTAVHQQGICWCYQHSRWARDGAGGSPHPYALHHHTRALTAPCCSPCHGVWYKLALDHVSCIIVCLNLLMQLLHLLSIKVSIIIWNLNVTDDSAHVALWWLVTLVCTVQTHTEHLLQNTGAADGHQPWSVSMGHCATVMTDTEMGATAHTDMATVLHECTSRTAQQPDQCKLLQLNQICTHRTSTMQLCTWGCCGWNAATAAEEIQHTRSIITYS